jgi:hypothetical protein
MRAIPTLTLYGTVTAGQLRNRERAADHTGGSIGAVTSENFVLSSTGAVAGIAGDLGGMTVAADAGI